MTIYNLKGRITEDGRLEIDLPAGVPAGEATVMLQPLNIGPNGQQLLAVLDKIHRNRSNRSQRTKEEIDAELNAMRDEWDNRGSDEYLHAKGTHHGGSSSRSGCA